MRKVKALLSIVAGLILLLQAGTSVAYADDDRHRGSAKAHMNADAKAQVAAKAERKSDSTQRAEANRAAVSEHETSQRAAVGQGSQQQTAQRAVSAANTSSPAGNNGTLKIHEGAVESQPDRANDPKVCTFHLHGFNFDGTSSGEWRISGQGQTDGDVWASGTWGVSDAEGDWRTGVMTLADGHYKAASWQTMPNDPPGGAKTKVFKVDCAEESTAGGQARREQRTAISIASDLKAQLDVRIAAAQQLLTSGTLTAAQQAALNAAINAATVEANDLAVAIAAALAAAEQAMANLNAATLAAVQANANLNAVVNAIASTNANISGVAGSTNMAVGVNAGSTASVVAGVETAPTMGNATSAASTESAGQAQGVQLGVETLPSTNTGSSVPLAALGTVLMSLGAWLLRKPVHRTE
jgi:LPXTG-motif cell wall-anchored protein